jgi:transcriptional regulator with XRE-family HTH domain
MAGVDKLLKAMRHQPSVAECFISNCTKTHQVSVVDQVELGYMLRKQRMLQNVSLREHSKAMKISAPYLSDLELGRRNFDLALVDRYLNALPKMPLRPTFLIRSPLSQKPIESTHGWPARSAGSAPSEGRTPCSPNPANPERYKQEADFGCRNDL